MTDEPFHRRRWKKVEHIFEDENPETSIFEQIPDEDDPIEDVPDDFGTDRVQWDEVD